MSISDKDIIKSRRRCTVSALPSFPQQHPSQSKPCGIRQYYSWGRSQAIKRISIIPFHHMEKGTGVPVRNDHRLLVFLQFFWVYQNRERVQHPRASTVRAPSFSSFHKLAMFHNINSLAVICVMSMSTAPESCRGTTSGSMSVCQ